MDNKKKYKKERQATKEKVKKWIMTKKFIMQREIHKEEGKNE